MEPTLTQTELIIRTLRECPDLAGFSEKEYKQLRLICHVEQYRKGQNVFAISWEGKYLFIVADGKLSLRLYTKEAKEFGPGDLFGEVGVFSNKGRLGTIRAKENSVLVAMDRNGIIEDSILPTELRLKLVLTLTRKALGYFYRDTPLSSPDLIAQGESESIEFKASGAYRHIEKVTQTITAFMNLYGGTIFMGVKNDGSLKGVPADEAEIDQFQQNLYNYIRDRVGKGYAQSVHFDAEEIDGKLIYRIDVESYPSPVFFKEKKNDEEYECFFVRTGTTNERLDKTSEIVDYVQRYYKM